MNWQKVRSWWSIIKDSIRGKEQDYTRISIKSAIVLLAIPMILEMAMESLFAVVDIFFIGHLGSEAIATVGLTETVLTIIYSVGMGISMAATAMVARRFGEKKYKEAGTATFQIIVFGLSISIILAILGWIYAPHILQLMGADEKVIEIGANYTRIIFAGNFAVMLLFLINGIFRGAGKPHLAMRALWISNGFNIVLDPLLIFGFANIEGLGLTGAAIATTTGRSIGVVYQLYHLLNGKHRLKIVRENIQLHLSVIKRIVKTSLGGMGQFLIESASWIFLMRIVSEFGSEGVAAFTITIRIIIFTLLPAWGLSAAAATLVGQNLGALKPMRAEMSVWVTAKYNMIFLLSVSVLYVLGGSFFTGLFSNDEVVVDIAAKALRIITLGYVFFGLGMVMIQAFNGAGDTLTPMIINIFVLWILQLPLAYVLAFVFNLEMNGVFITIAFCHSIHALVSWRVFRLGNWKKMKI